MSSTIYLLIFILLIVFIVWYAYNKNKMPKNKTDTLAIHHSVKNQDHVVMPPKIRKIIQPTSPYPSFTSMVDSETASSCKVSNQLGCKLVEGSQIYQNIKDAVVMLSVNQSWQGTGFFVSADGYIVTAAHVISQAKDENDEKGAIVPATEIYALVAPKYDVYKCRVVGIDGTGDIGVLKIDQDDPFNQKNPPIKGQKFLKFYDKPSTGELAFVLGYPLGTDLSSFSMGIVRNEKFVAPSLFIPFNVILITSPAYQGNSGSPIVDVNGNVIGLLTFVYYANEQTFESIGGGPTASTVNLVSERLIEADQKKVKGLKVPAYFDKNNLKYRKGYLGFDSTKVVWFSDIPTLNQKYKFPFRKPIGFRGKVSKDSPLSGIVGDKDIIVKIDGKEIGALPSQTAPGDILWRKLPGEKVRIDYYPFSEDGYGSMKTADIILKEYPDKVDTFEGRALKVEMECIGDACSLAGHKSSQDDFWLPSSSTPVGF